VIIRDLTWTRFRIPLTGGFANARWSKQSREGWIVRLVTDEGIAGVGEASPLAEHTGTPGPPVEVLLADTRAALVGGERPDLGIAASSNEAAIRFAVETAMLDARGRRESRSIASIFALCRSAVPVNATIGGLPLEDARAAAKAAVDAGFTCVKLKVGGRPLAEDEARVGAVREVIGDAMLRLDANGAWTPDEARTAISALAPYLIELIEQPVAPGQLDLMRGLRSLGVPIAADEEITGIDSARRVLAANAANFLVLKPMVVGGNSGSWNIAKEAQAAGVGVFVTTTIDTGIATAAALHLAATLGTPHCGLATAPLLAADLLVTPLAVENGMMPVPTGPGLGVELDEAQLARFAA
jgi:L-alanine-DL-glutamate epimerase-like enolase superfamily enzyme